MRIFLTYDYELFFGKESGTVTKCMMEPTNDLLLLAKDKSVYYTFFVDVGYLVAAEKYPELTAELEQVKAQIKEMISNGHDVQLHIHPHWESSVWKEGKWEMNTEGNYRLADFDPSERTRIIKTYKSKLESIIGRPCNAFRAGGWCIQPFDELKDDFIANQIKIDSSVIPGDLMITNNYYLDFRTAPKLSKYRFEDDVCKADDKGKFIEYPISSLRYSPLFFWQLYVLGRISPDKHKMIGDGKFISQGGRRKRVLTTYSTHHVSTDGYYAKKLEAGLQKAINLGHEEMVVIGHPKGNTKYSVQMLEKFIEGNYTKHSFTTFDREFENN